MYNHMRPTCGWYRATWSSECLGNWWSLAR